jgi:DNA-binding MarR family transcriptional regulator
LRGGTLHTHAQKLEARFDMDATRSNQDTPERRRAIRWQLAQAELIDEIVGAAQHVRAATTHDGIPIVRTDALWLLLRALERASYSCSISDAARLLRASRQRAQRLAHQAEIAGLVELLANADDDRIIQILLTPRARAELAHAKRIERSWEDRLLLGLKMEPMLTATRVLRVIRQRLMRDARDRR